MTALFESGSLCCCCLCEPDSKLTALRDSGVFLSLATFFSFVGTVGLLNQALKFLGKCTNH